MPQEERGPFFDLSRFVYASPLQQSKLAAASLIMVHEAAHLVRETPSYIEEEMVCRTLEMLYYEDLLDGRTYISRVTGATCTARLLPDPFAVAILRGVYTNQRDYYKEGQLIDSILEASEYRADLTPAFIDRSFHWWGEIQNRLPRTKGYYLQTLSADDNPRSDLILAILESIRRLADWEIVKQTAGISVGSGKL